MEARIKVYSTLLFGLHPQTTERRDVANVGRDYVDLGDTKAIISDAGPSLQVEIVKKRSHKGSEHLLTKFEVSKGQVETYPDDTLSRLAGGKFIEVEHVNKTSR